MPEAAVPGATLSYQVHSEGEPLLLIAGCGQPAEAWRFSLAPRLSAAGYAVVTFDNRGVAPSSSPPAPYSVDVMAADTVALLDHLGWHAPVRVAGHSLGGWIAETLVLDHPGRVRAAALMGSANIPTAWEVAITTVERDLARLDHDLPPLFYATETLRYLPIADIQDSEVVSTWLSLIGELPPWPNPGRLGQYEAALAWSTDPARGTRWHEIATACLVLAFEHDVDSPPRDARRAAAAIPRCEYREIAGAGHLGILTHADEVARHLVEFFAARLSAGALDRRPRPVRVRVRGRERLLFLLVEVLLRVRPVTVVGGFLGVWDTGGQLPVDGDAGGLLGVRAQEAAGEGAPRDHGQPVRGGVA